MLEAAIDVVRAEFSKLPDSEQLIGKVAGRLQAMYDQPPVGDFEFVMHKTFAVEEVRKALFDPLDDQVAYYAALLSAALSTPSGHPLRKTGSFLLTLLYLIHRYGTSIRLWYHSTLTVLCFLIRKNYNFLKEFVVADGLQPIVLMFCHDNLYERSQAMEIFLSITDCDVYDWFATPQTFTDRMMHHKLLTLSENPHFLANLMRNRTESYPGGSFRSLQLLAFWLSWVRAIYTEDQTLKLSASMLNELELWANQAPNPDAGILEEEIQLASTLYNDFRKASIVEELPASDSTATYASAKDNQYTLTGVLTASVAPTPSVAEIEAARAKQLVLDAARAKLLPPPTQTLSLQTAHEIKDEGNALYRQGNLLRARARYEDALQMLDSLPAEPAGNDSSTSKLDLEVTLRSNLSNTLWKLYVDAKKGRDRAEPSSTAAAITDVNDEDLVELLTLMMTHCRAALQVQPTHAKACYRLLLCMLERKETRAAYDYAEDFKAKLLQPQPAVEGGSLSSNVHEDIERFSRIQRRCAAFELLRHQQQQQEEEGGSPVNNSSSAAFDASHWGLTPARMRILSAVLKRQNLAHLIPTTTDVTSSSSTTAKSSSSSSRGASSAVATEDIEKIDPKVDKVLNYLFEQRDVESSVDVASSAASTVTKSTAKSTAGGAGKTKSSKVVSTADKSKAVKSDASSSGSVAKTSVSKGGGGGAKKVSAKSRGVLQDVKVLATTFAKLLLRSKAAEDSTIVLEQETLLREGYSVRFQLSRVFSLLVVDMYFLKCFISSLS